jgi:hypothetical protein
MNPVDREDLVPGKLYYIECMTQDLQSNVIPNVGISIMVGIFIGLKPIYTFSREVWKEAHFRWFDVSNLKCMQHESDSHKHILRDVGLNYLWRFYEVKKFKIQSDMEGRAVNLYLQKIIGDPYFTYPCPC